ncbi:L,D-transpeptidase family protein [Pleomorphovibrio marinus]|uniref:L,D-transpeptidase family protein n=1 Tax=Pleomorphovibrio marinus TaxID=2164132 RepID=UPI000E0BD94F|nr:L,D-transpeptidase family protein [Pleomorphovibrio marinus]
MNRLNKYLSKISFFTGITLFFHCHSLLAQEVKLDDGVTFEIRNLYESHAMESSWMIGERRLYHPNTGLQFYAQRNFKPAWSSLYELSCKAYEMKYHLHQSKFDGLTPSDYHVEVIDQLVAQVEEAKREGETLSSLELAALDILLTDAFITYGTHLNVGKIDPEHSKTGWEIQKKQPNKDILRKLELGLEETSIRVQLESLWPGFTMYGRMRTSLMELYEMLAEMPNQWPQLSLSTAIKPNESHALIPAIRERVAYWEGSDADEERVTDGVNYDSTLLEQLKDFQTKNGLQPDGVIGQATLRALNKSPNDLIRQATVNMERLRWLPDTTLSEFILVNIANYSMDYIRKGDTLLHSKAIVGKSYRKTPVFNAAMTYLVFSPTWTVPPTILRNDVIPAVKKDPGYLKAKNMRLLTYSGQEVSPANVDWNSISASNFPYMVRQDPGPSNSLGWVKFMFPNKYNVYIHDTPSRELFMREDRALSSGCVRIQKPLELATFLLADQPLWTQDRIRSSMFGGKEQTVMLKRPIPVVLLYLTFWTDSEGVAMFRQDIYSRDEDLFKALSQPIKISFG